MMCDTRKRLMPMAVAAFVLVFSARAFAQSITVPSNAANTLNGGTTGKTTMIDFSVTSSGITDYQYQVWCTISGFSPFTPFTGGAPPATITIDFSNFLGGRYYGNCSLILYGNSASVAATGAGLNVFVPEPSVTLNSSAFVSGTTWQFNTQFSDVEIYNYRVYNAANGWSAPQFSPAWGTVPGSYSAINTTIDFSSVSGIGYYGDVVVAFQGFRAPWNIPQSSTTTAAARVNVPAPAANQVSSVSVTSQSGPDPQYHFGVSTAAGASVTSYLYEVWVWNASTGAFTQVVPWTSTTSFAFTVDIAASVFTTGTNRIIVDAYANGASVRAPFNSFGTVVIP